MARTVRIKGALTILDPSGKNTEVNYAFDKSMDVVEIARLTYTIPKAGAEYEIPFGQLPQATAFLLVPSAPLDVKYNSNTNSSHRATGPVIEFSTITKIYVTPDPVVDITLDVILLGP